MKRLRGVCAVGKGRTRAWPIMVVAADPYAGDEALFMPGSYEDYRRHAERIGLQDALDQATHDRLDGIFEQAYRSILDGDVDAASIRDVAVALQVWGARSHDRRPKPLVPVVVDDKTLAAMAEDQLPQIGQVAPDRIVGPWADEPLPRWVRVVAAAAMCFAPEVPPGVPAWARSIKRSPKPNQQTCSGLRAIARIPPMLWTVAKDRTVSPMLPFARQLTPDGPVHGLPATPAVVGRVVPGPDGWALVAGLPLVQAPPVPPLLARLDIELLRLRRRERRLTFEDLLRERGELLYRTACEWLFDSQLRASGTVPWETSGQTTR